MTQIAIPPVTVRSSSVGQVRTLSVLLGVTVAAIIAALYLAATSTGAPPVITAAVIALAVLVGAQGVRTDCGWNAAVRLVLPSEHRPIAVISAHVLGLLVGSLVTGALVAGLGILIPPFGAIWLAIPFLVVGALRIFRPTTVVPGGWKVRRVWERWGLVRYMGVFGFFLGLGFVTTIVSPSFFLLIAWGLGSATIFAPLAAFAGFAGGRVVTTLISASGDARGSSTTCVTVDSVKTRIRVLGSIEGVLTVLIGIALTLGLAV